MVRARAGIGAAVAGAMMLLAVAPAQARNSVDPCGAETRRQERAHGIPAGLLSAISLVESGRFDKHSRASIAWPWTVMAEGKGRFLPSKAAAIAEVAALQARGVRNIDVGCMQINLQAHRDAFPNLATAFDPGANVAYAAKFLLRLREETGSWARAGTHYHSRTPHLAAAYRVKLALAWNRIHDDATPPATKARQPVQGGIAWGAATVPRPPLLAPVVKRTAEPVETPATIAAKRAEAKRAADAWRAEKLAEYHLRKIKPGAIPPSP